MSDATLRSSPAAATGIGAAICRQMLDDGYEVISLSRRKMDWRHDRLTALEVDLLDSKATAEAAADIASRFAGDACRAQCRRHPAGTAAGR